MGGGRWTESDGRPTATTGWTIDSCAAVSSRLVVLHSPKRSSWSTCSHCTEPDASRWIEAMCVYNVTDCSLLSWRRVWCCMGRVQKYRRYRNQPVPVENAQHHPAFLYSIPQFGGQASRINVSIHRSMLFSISTVQHSAF